MVGTESYYQKVQSRCFPATSLWWSEFLHLYKTPKFLQKYFQLLVRGLCIVCFDSVCGFLMVTAHACSEAQLSSCFSKPFDLLQLICGTRLINSRPPNCCPQLAMNRDSKSSSTPAKDNQHPPKPWGSWKREDDAKPPHIRNRFFFPRNILTLRQLTSIWTLL